MRVNFGDYYLPVLRQFTNFDADPFRALRDAYEADRQRREEVREELHSQKASARARVKADRHAHLASLWPVLPTDWDKVSIVVFSFDLLLPLPFHV